jgi:hypothetical protein
MATNDRAWFVKMDAYFVWRNCDEEVEFRQASQWQPYVHYFKYLLHVLRCLGF